jgi:Raf kinase inhibitor-like YbhB/YbcL family protein
MNKSIGFAIVAFVFVLGPLDAQAAPTPPPGLHLATDAFDDGGVIPAKYTRTGPNWVSPALNWTNVPPGTVSFALLTHDPDVSISKTTEDVLHWLIFNIPGTALGLPEGVPFEPTLADGSVQAKNRRGLVGFLGPGAPANGPYHHYTFELFALDTVLNLGPDATRADFLKAIDGHILGKAALVGRFHLPS